MWVRMSEPIMIALTLLSVKAIIILLSRRNFDTKLEDNHKAVDKKIPFQNGGQKKKKKTEFRIFVSRK